MANVSDASHMPPATQHTGEEADDGFQKAGFISPWFINLHLDKVCLLIEHRAENILFPTYFIYFFYFLFFFYFLPF